MKGKKQTKNRQRMVRRVKRGGGGNWMITPRGENFLFKILSLAPSTPHEFRNPRMLIIEVLKLLTNRAFLIERYTDVHGFSYNNTHYWCFEITNANGEIIHPAKRTKTVIDINKCFEIDNKFFPELFIQQITEGFDAEIQLREQLKKVLSKFDRYLTTNPTTYDFDSYRNRSLEELVTRTIPSKEFLTLPLPKFSTKVKSIFETRENKIQHDKAEAMVVAQSIFPNEELRVEFDRSEGKWFTYTNIDENRRAIEVAIQKMREGMSCQIKALNFLKRNAIPKIVEVFNLQQLDTGEYKSIPIELNIEDADKFSKSVKEFEIRIDDAIADKQNALDTFNQRGNKTKSLLQHMHESKPPITIKKQNSFNVQVDTKRQIANAIMGYNDGLQTSQITPKDRNFLLTNSGIQTLLKKRLHLQPRPTLLLPRPTQAEADDDDDEYEKEKKEVEVEVPIPVMEEVD
jgi:hypothetical protein